MKVSLEIDRYVFNNQSPLKSGPKTFDNGFAETYQSKVKKLVTWLFRIMNIQQITATTGTLEIFKTVPLSPVTSECTFDKRLGTARAKKRKHKEAM